MNRQYQLDDETARTLMAATDFTVKRTLMPGFKEQLLDAQAALAAQNSELERTDADTLLEIQ